MAGMTAFEKAEAERVRQALVERRARAVAVASELRGRHQLVTSRVWDDMGGLAFGFNVSYARGDVAPADVVFLRSDSEGTVAFRWGWEVKHAAAETDDPVEVAAAIAATLGKTRPARDARNAEHLAAYANL